MGYLRLIILVALALFVVSDGTPTSEFLTCLTPKITTDVPGTATFSNLTKRNFMNIYATPAVIVQARSTDDVSKAIKCAQKSKLRVCARSNGHSLVGHSLCEGVVVDVGLMRKVAVAENGIAHVEAGTNLGEFLWAVHAKKRWFASGNCPGVGIAGFLMGGGQGFYASRLGLACDSLHEATMVDRFGRVLVASKQRNSDLLWALCGSGGNQFGIVTSFKLRTADSRPFDRSVAFRVTWKPEFIARVLKKFIEYQGSGGHVRVRMSIAKGEKLLHGSGACFDVSGVEECLKKLNEGAFFRTPGRNITFMEKARNALDFQAFTGPDGGWGRRLAKDLRKALLEKRYVDAGQANERARRSVYLKLGRKKRPSLRFWQEYSDFCQSTTFKSIPWWECILDPFKDAIHLPNDNAFAHRDANFFSHFIIGGGTKEEKTTAYTFMKKHFAQHTAGMAVNYPELEENDYARQYWGKSLGRLRTLKKRFDPDIFFSNPQSIPLSVT